MKPIPSEREIRSSSGHPSSDGFTLVESLVAISVISLLVAIALPAAQAAREAGRRAACLNNLRQVGLGLSHYEAHHGCFPAGRYMTYDPRFSGPNYPCTSSLPDKSLLLAILPFIGEQPLFSAINANLAIAGFENRTVQVSRVALYSCPTDPESRVRPLAVDQLIAVGMAAPGDVVATQFTSYSGCMGPYFIRWRPCDPRNPEIAAQLGGVFHDLGCTRASAIRDGLSQTLFVCEKATTTFDMLRGIDPSAFDRFGWFFSNNLGDTILSTFHPPNAYRKVSLGAVDARVYSGSSLHPGGLNILMGDGSARFISDNIDTWCFSPSSGEPCGAVRSGGRGIWTNTPRPGVWQALSTRAGGELIAPD